MKSLNMTIERKLRNTIAEQDAEICELQYKINHLESLNRNMWDLYQAQSRELKILRKEINKK